MIANFSNINEEFFIIKDGLFCGDESYLIVPKHINAQWNQNNKFFRSSIWRKSDGKLISAAFKKFVNWSEKPDTFPVPLSLKDCNIVTKIDGSLLCIDFYNGQINTRTRGTFNTDTLNNGHEIKILKQKYPKLFSNCELLSGKYSIICEWVSDENTIVLKYPNCPDVFLIAVINLEDYSYLTQKEVDDLAIQWQVKRPVKFDLNNTDDIFTIITQKEDIEGVCVYSPLNGKSDQEIHKIKSTKYLALHKLKSDLSCLEKILDIYLQRGEPNYSSFFVFVSDTFDFELANQIRGDISKLCDAKKEVEKILSGMEKFLKKIKNLPSRKDQAKEIINSYGGEKNNRAQFLFCLLDEKEITIDQRKKLYFQVLK